jgi:hypothetical protein
MTALHAFLPSQPNIGLCHKRFDQVGVDADGAIILEVWCLSSISGSVGWGAWENLDVIPGLCILGKAHIM